MPLERYTTDDYFKENPDWDISDSPWKADMVKRIIERNHLEPKSFLEVGCGAGAVLSELSKSYPESNFIGYDIAPAAAYFWDKYTSGNVNFTLGDFVNQNNGHYDVLMALDVLEHVADPFVFLRSLSNSAEYFIFHIPLDLCAASVIRETPLLYVRKKVGHIHYFTRGIAVSLLQECGYTVIDWFYTDASYSNPARKSVKAFLTSIPRYILNLVSRDVSARLIGGQTLLLLAKKCD